MKRSLTLSRAAPDTEADVEAPKSIKLCPDQRGSNQSSFSSSGHRSTAVEDKTSSSLNTFPDDLHSLTHREKTPLDQDVLATTPEKWNAGPGLQKRSAATDPEVEPDDDRD